MRYVNNKAGSFGDKLDKLTKKRKIKVQRHSCLKIYQTSGHAKKKEKFKDTGV